MIRYQTICSLSAIVCLVLFGVFLVAPNAYAAGYGVAADAGGAFLGNRAAPLFLGLAAMCWLLRQDESRQVRAAVSVAMILTFAGIAATGVWAFTQGVAGPTILIAAVAETLLAVAFIVALRTN